MQLFGIAVGVAALELCVAEQHLHFVEEFRADTDPFAAAADGSAVWVKSSRPEYTHGNDAIHIKPVFEPMTGFENKRAMILTGEHMKYGVSARMPSAFDMGTDAAGAAGAAHKEFVVQYEVLHEEVGYCCGHKTYISTQTLSLYTHSCTHSLIHSLANPRYCTVVARTSSCCCPART